VEWVVQLSVLAWLPVLQLQPVLLAAAPMAQAEPAPPAPTEHRLLKQSKPSDP
jgi:hypothetical protein